MDIRELEHVLRTMCCARCALDGQIEVIGEQFSLQDPRE
jgi:hypothetical protein